MQDELMRALQSGDFKAVDSYAGSDAEKAKEAFNQWKILRAAQNADEVFNSASARSVILKIKNSILTLAASNFGCFAQPLPAVRSSQSPAESSSVIEIPQTGQMSASAAGVRLEIKKPFKSLEIFSEGVCRTSVFSSEKYSEVLGAGTYLLKIDGIQTEIVIES